MASLNPHQFAQMHRGIIVNLRMVERIERDLLGRSRVHLRGQSDTLPLSRNFVERFKPCKLMSPHAAATLRGAL